MASRAGPNTRVVDLRIPRRKLLEGGLAGFATIMMSRALGACDGPVAGAPDSARHDGGFPLDAQSDAGLAEFPIRDIPPRPPLRSRIAELGPLGDPDENGVRLPAGFRSRVIARSGQPVLPGSSEWHLMPDGGATYGTEDGGWIYVSNSEVPLVGGVGAIRFSADGDIVASYRILERTSINCAGGVTPWHTWLSCEEHDRGQVYECDPWGEHPARVRPALGTFQHEAAAVDPVRGHIYLSEDVRDGRFYRFVPARRTPRGTLDLSSGRLEVAVVDRKGNVRWVEVPDPLLTGRTPTRHQVAESTIFNGGEGLWYHENMVYLATKGDNRIWAYDAVASRISVLYDAADHSPAPLRGVDNVTVSCCGDVLVAEDGGSMQIVAILPSGEARALVQVVGHDTSEITGPAFDPSGTRLYFSSQRGAASGGGGVTFEVTGPFHEPA